eukprot:TRINITY_DN6648_c0_g1_i1.p1 TRINITY_DN6648_c0_g1~~TRINITY_DN6648_c0_g1_i1.p1  ORF type:complete len:108 (+),score=13.23 TRINITY_DN6648_c0_g1_i1:95-418(+)
MPLRVYFPDIPLTIYKNFIATKGVVQFKTKHNQSKPIIKNNLEKVYGIKVLKVNTMNYDGKIKRTANVLGGKRWKTKGYKKAIVWVDKDYFMNFQNDFKTSEESKDK